MVGELTLDSVPDFSAAVISTFPALSTAFALPFLLLTGTTSFQPRSTVLAKDEECAVSEEVAAGFRLRASL
jgi:hypothetical protein